MKKIFLSVFVILTFTFYVIYQRLSLTFAPATQEIAVNGNTSPATSPSASVPTSVSSPLPASSHTSNTGLKDGQYTGDTIDAYYGNVQVQVAISGGKITDVQFLDYPHDRRTSIEINTQAMPDLKQEAITAQNSQVDIVSGATQTSLAFRQSLQSALDKAK